MDWNGTLAMLKRHEGFRQFPYKDSVGILTIGHGRNLESKGLSEKEAEELLKNDISEVIPQLQKLLFFEELDDVRQGVLVDMAVNLGVSGLMKFKKMILAINEKRYVDASNEMLNSLWAKQVKGRAIELAEKMKSGV